MARYAIRVKPARAPAPQRRSELEIIWHDAAPLPHPLIYEREPAQTGVLDANGNPIYRLPDPVGYLAFDEGDE